jgi:hypothetical protein
VLVFRLCAGACRLPAAVEASTAILAPGKVGGNVPVAASATSRRASVLADLWKMCAKLVGVIGAHRLAPQETGHCGRGAQKAVPRLTNVCFF